MVILHVRPLEYVSYQRRLATLLDTWRREEVVPTVPEVDFSCLVEYWILLWLVVKRQYLAHERYFEARLRMCHNLLVGRRNVEIFCIMAAV